ncbi:unnamed protein product [Cuscuta campestris]|uniref:Aminotransferase-like plant mobile domain-containing protein n=1 Tax=Cuscuta campestris TaxID=132261 RepID=A0A484L5B3_9ASTE|nr:unnamed protein product [Cuscuta campestris]
MTGRSRDQWIQICEDMMGFRPRTSDITSTMIKMSAIVPKKLSDQSLDVDYLQHARAIMFKLLGGSLFPNTTGNRVSLYLLEIIMGDANIVRGRAIGSAVLSYLYRSMCRASPTSAAQIGGCLVLLQLWAWERLPMTRPRGVIPLDQLVDVPDGCATIDGQIVPHTPYEHTGTSLIDCSRESLFGCRIRILRPYRPIVQLEHSGIDHAFNNVPELLGGQVTRRFCLRHVRSNFHSKFRSKKLKNMMYNAGKTPSISEFEHTLLEITSKNQEAYNWLMAIPKHMWALSHDEGGARYGITTTNSSESFNRVLKGCRCLPVFAIVRFTYDKLVKLFVDRRTNGYLWQQSGYNFPMNVWKKIKHNEENRLYCRVVQHHAQHGIYSVVVDGSFNNGHRETFAVNLNARTCTCGYWSYINAYSGILMPLPDEANWPTPGYEIFFSAVVLKSEPEKDFSIYYSVKSSWSTLLLRLSPPSSAGGGVKPTSHVLILFPIRLCPSISR